MGKKYNHLTLEERIELSHLVRNGISLREIGRQLGRSTSTISREVQRNSRSTKVWKEGYEPVRAQALQERRRYRGKSHKLASQPELQRLVYDLLAMGWSPEQIAGRLAQQHGKPVISHESIYRFIYYRSAQKDYWHRLLPQRKFRRGKLMRGGLSPVKTIRDRVSISARPQEINNRTSHGHWEADLMLFRTYSQAILVMHERKSRLLLVTRQPNKTAQSVVESINLMMQNLSPHLCQSITFDNGTEFAYHHQLKERLGIRTYFCDPHKPWQKGGVENAIGRMRRFLPRKTDLGMISRDNLDRYLFLYNNTPRKCLGFLTPNEAFNYAQSNVALQT